MTKPRPKWNSFACFKYLREGSNSERGGLGDIEAGGRQVVRHGPRRDAKKRWFSYSVYLNGNVIIRLGQE
jgi:hypothetical protein